MKRFCKLAALGCLLAALNGLALPASAASAPSGNGSFDGDIEITYKIPGEPEEIRIGVIPDKVPHPGMDFYDKREMQGLARVYFRACMQLRHREEPETFSYTVYYPGEPEKNYSETVSTTFTAMSLGQTWG